MVPVATIETITKALLEISGVKADIKIISSRHGEKLNETLLTREEKTIAEGCGKHFRIPEDTRSLDYNIYFIEGELAITQSENYSSSNTTQLNVKQKKELLKKLDFAQGSFNL
jgi:UDP-N-acetylglucosamine 4,6-dehydratase/5-epimerase